MTVANDVVPPPPSDKGYFCSTCGAADVIASDLAGGEASCNVCGWRGKVEELARFDFKHEMGSQEAILRHFFKDLRNLLSAELAVSIGGMLIKWGFIDAPTPETKSAVNKRLARYIAGMAKGMAEGIIRTRAELEKENHDHGN